jgi:hypothetical protein
VNINKIDVTPPVINCPPDVTVNALQGKCYASVAEADLGTATASDKCAMDHITKSRDDGQPFTANYPVGTNSITWTAFDASGNTATCKQNVIVRDVEPPVISNVTQSVYALAPPNHQLKDVTVNYTATDLCSGPVTTSLSVTSNEPINGTSDGDTSPDWIVVDNHHVKLRSERAGNGNGRIYTITITATDGAGNTTTTAVEVRVAHDIKGPGSGHPFLVGSTINFNGVFWDKPTNTHYAKWLIDGSTSAKGLLTEPTTNKNGTVTGSYKFTTAGVYKLQMNVIDQNNVTTYANTNGDIEEIVVIYDPNGGYTYGGGWFESQAGALVSDPTATGKASYGFTVNYFKTSTYPKGETQFEFKVGSLEFNALNFDYLVINGARAQFKGSGKVTGGSERLCIYHDSNRRSN